MKHTIVWLMALAVIMPQISNATGVKMSQDEQNALAAIETMTMAFQNKDLSSVMASYESPATIVFEPGVPVADPVQMKQIFGEMALIDPIFEYPAGHEVIVNEDIALHIAPWSMTGKTPDGQSIAQSGLSVAVLRRQSDDSWKMVIDNPHGGQLLSQGH